MVEEDRPDSVGGNGREPYDVDLATDPDVVVYRISGAFFFGAAAGVGAALDRIGERPKAYVIDLSAVPMLDSTGAATIEAFARKAHRQGAAVYISGAARTDQAHAADPWRAAAARALPQATGRRREGCAPRCSSRRAGSACCRHSR